MGKYDLIVLNFANMDMVGHTGDLRASRVAVEAVELSQGRVRVRSKHDFVGLDYAEVRWELTADGEVVQEGELPPLALPARGEQEGNA